MASTAFISTSSVDGAKPPDERNIEIKACICSEKEFERRIQLARSLTATEGEIIIQHDVFFDTRVGRLKLRYLQPPARSQLVYYDRPNVIGPKLSRFNKIEVDEPEVLEKMLTITNGNIGKLVKTRYLFLHDQTRIHLDKVEQIGNFMEFEVCLRPEQTIEEGQTIAEKLMKVFGIAREDLQSGSYFDSLPKK